MRKYLLPLLSTVAILSLEVLSKSRVSYEGADYNEEVTRKINLDIHSAVEVITDIKFRSKSTKGTDNYYFVVPRELEDN